VNSKNSTVVISLKDEEDDSDSTGIVETTPSESVTTESTESSSETESQSESEKRQEELDLLKDLITSLTSTSSLLSD
jgi:hypothetical protein